MKPRINGIAFILWARDILRTEQFYTTHLGIQFTRNTEEDGSVWLLAKIGKEVEMLVFKGNPKPAIRRASRSAWRRAASRRSSPRLRRPASNVTPVSEAPGGWSAEFRDLDGHPMSFFQDQALPKTLAKKA